MLRCFNSYDSMDTIPYEYIIESLMNWTWKFNKNSIRKNISIKIGRTRYFNIKRDFDAYTIFTRITSLKVANGVLKEPNQAGAKRYGVINPQNYNFQLISIRKILMLSNATNQPKSTVELGYMCPRGLTGPPAVTLTK